MTQTYNPEKTREELVQAAFHEIWRNGFRSASVDTILRETGVTKGALYYHFENKDALGHAVLDEVVKPIVVERWLKPLEQSLDPIQTLKDILHSFKTVDAQERRCGCPLNNLAQELSPVDEDFRRHIQEIYTLWVQGIAKALRQGQQRGVVAASVEPQHCAVFLVAAIEGVAGMLKNGSSKKLLEGCEKGVKHYLDSLRPNTKA